MKILLLVWKVIFEGEKKYYLEFVPLGAELRRGKEKAAEGELPEKITNVLNKKTESEAQRGDSKVPDEAPTPPKATDAGSGVQEAEVTGKVQETGGVRLENTFSEQRFGNAGCLQNGKLPGNERPHKNKTDKAEKNENIYENQEDTMNNAGTMPTAETSLVVIERTDEETNNTGRNSWRNCATRVTKYVLGDDLSNHQNLETYNIYLKADAFGVMAIYIPFAFLPAWAEASGFNRTQQQVGSQLQ